MSNTTKTEQHASNESKDLGCGCGGAHKHHKPTPLRQENVAPGNESKSEASHEHNRHSHCCGGGKAGK